MTLVWCAGKLKLLGEFQEFKVRSLVVVVVVGGGGGGGGGGEASPAPPLLNLNPAPFNSGKHYQSTCTV